MPVSLKHTFQSAKTDSADVTIVQPSNWNQEHQLTLATNKVLGRATAGTGAAEELSIGAALSISGGTLAVTTVPAANGGTGLISAGTSGNVLTSNGTTWTSAAAPSSAVQYPQNSQSANYTLVLGDAGKQIFHPVSDTTVRTYTIPANSSVAFPIGSVVLFTVENGGTQVNVAITSDTLVNGTGLTGTQPVLANNTLMCIKVTATKWMANYLYQKDARSRFQFAVGHSVSPYISAYSWASNTGIGAIYNNPATLPTGDGNGVAFSPSGDAVALAHATTPFVSAYPWSIAGFGTKYANPATLPPSQSTSVAFSPASDVIALATPATPIINAYPWNSSTGFGTKYSNPATLPAGIGRGVAFSPVGDAVAIAHDTTPFVSAYPWTVASGFGTKYANPATLPAGNAKSIAFHPAGNAIIVGHTTAPYVTAYPWSASGFGTKYTNPAISVFDGTGVAFSPAGDAVISSTNLGINIYAWRWSSAGFGQQYSAPVTFPTGVGNGVAFSPTADAVAVAHGTTPFMSLYPWSGSAGYGTKYTDPFTLPTGTGLSIAFNAII